MKAWAGAGATVCAAMLSFAATPAIPIYGMLAIASMVAPSSARAQTGTPVLNQLTAAESAAGWKLLFDGKGDAGWIKPDGSKGEFVLDGSAPSAASPLYASPITVSGSKTVMAVTVRAGQAMSAASSENYQAGGTSLLPRLAAEDFRAAVRGSGSGAGLYGLRIDASAFQAQRLIRVL